MHIRHLEVRDEDGKEQENETGRAGDRKWSFEWKQRISIYLVLTVILHTENPDVLFDPIMLPLKCLKPKSLLPMIKNSFSKGPPYVYWFCKK